MKRTSICCSAALALLISAPSGAQTVVSPQILTMPTGASRSALVAAVAQPLTFSRGQGVSNGHLVAATDVLISAAPALQEFRLWFNNGDHKMRRIGVLHEEGSMRANFSDQNDDDPFRAAASWINVPGATGGTLTATGGGSFRIQLPPKPPNTTLVLSGFSFERLSGTDNNLRTISMKINQDAATVDVSLIDDQGSDFRSVIDPFMTGGLVGNLPFGAIVGGVMSTEAMVRAIMNEGRNTARPFAATVQYAYIPNTRVAANGSVSGTNRSRDAIQGQIPNRSPMALRGFSFRFNNSDHHMLGVGVHFWGMPSFPGQRGGSAESPITYQDNNFDDPIQWIVDYTLLK
jgi:hypothetical protein